ncbi:MAG: flagellar biosynthesis protein FliC [Ignavibacteria bacterium CG2_30_36_16]|nr:flagellar biosynthesis protein FliC [Ignavibacteria bacterium]OIP54686.1 MAG: flagellar biosynthesis protein FliC [Ignavibacteria bacterium CG2_30_36_16]
MSLFKINTNIGALNAYNALAKVNSQAEKAQLRLATQKRINSVADDTSGYRVGKELQGKVTLMQASQGNIGSAKDMLSTAESALSAINDLINQIKGKVAESIDPSKNKTSLAADVAALGNEIDSIFSNTKFNDTALLSGSSYSAAFSFRTGVEETTSVNFGTMSTLDLSSLTGASSSTVTSVSVSSIETAVSNALGSIGNFSQRLDVKDEYLTAAISNATASVSRLFDADMAIEQLNATKGQIGSQVATSMLAQMNAAPQGILSLFR